MFLEAKEAPEPATDMTVDKSSLDSELELSPAQLITAGWVYVYRIETGEPVPINKNMLLDKLKIMKDGKKVFTTVKPEGVTVRKGIIKCLLHPSHPDRERFNEMGLPVCRKSNIPSKYELTRHMEIKHKTAWKTLELERIEKEKEEDKRFQRDMLKQMASSAQVNKRRKRT